MDHYDDKFIHMEKIPKYEDSDLSYCKKCYDNKLYDLCEICNKNIQGFSCEQNDLTYICYQCMCDGINCDYCHNI